MLDFSKYAQFPIGGVRYNVIRRPFSGVGSIKRRKATAKQKEETKDEYYERLRTDYVAAEPANWFFRWEVPIGSHDIQAFRDTCLDPLLEQICDWYAEVTGRPTKTPPGYRTPLHFRHPYGVRNSIDEGYLTEYDWLLQTGHHGSLVRAESLFNELKVGM